MKVTRLNPFTGKVRSLELLITFEQKGRIDAGEHIQNACPHLSADEREFYISGILGKEFDKLFKEEDE